MVKAVHVATTSTIEGWVVREYLGLVSAHVVAGTGLFSDFKAGFSDLFGGRSGSYQKQLASLQGEVIENLRQKTHRMGANWVLGARIDFDEISGKNMQMLMVSACGTAVLAEPIQGTATGGAVGRAIAAAELHAGLKRMALIEQAAKRLLRLDEETWLALAELKVVEATAPIIEALSRLKGTYEYQEAYNRAVDFFRALPIDDLQRELHAIIATEPKKGLLATHFVASLGLVDLGWIKDHLGSGDFEIRRIALQLLQADAPLYTEADLPVLQSVLSLLPTAFPETAKLVEKKSAFARTPDQRWLCPCGKDNDFHHDYCGACSKDRRGLAQDDFKPEQAIARLSRQLDFLRSALTES